MLAAESPISLQVVWLPCPTSASCSPPLAWLQGRCRGSLNYATSPYLSDFWDIASAYSPRNYYATRRWWSFIALESTSKNLSTSASEWSGVGVTRNRSVP